MGCCSSAAFEPPSISCSDSSFVRELESNIGSQHISQSSLLKLLDNLQQQPADKNRLEIIKGIKNEKFVLDDFDAILNCFTTSNGKLAATRILKKNLIGTEFNSGFLIKHFTNQQQNEKSFNSIDQSTSHSAQSLTSKDALINENDNDNHLISYT